MAVVANPLVVRIFINSTLTSRGSGWAERWPIWETEWDKALGYALQMVQARQRVLSSNAYIQWACLGSVTTPYYEQTVVTDQLYPLPQWGPAAFDMQGVLFELNNEAGENAPRLFRAIDATEIAAGRWKYADMLIPPEPPALPVNLATAPKHLLWQNTLATFRKYAATDQPMSDGHHGPGFGYWVDHWDQIVYRQVSARRWGRPWKRMSWEAAPFANAPQFSPCGCVVTVNRISYAIPCRFGPGWSLRWIHYYEAKEDATVMTFKTPFCAWNRSLEYTVFSGVGEAKKFQRRNWTNGREWGNAPGVMWTGPQSYFEGNAPQPPIPTPGFMRPACDAPVVPPGLIPLGGAGGGGVGIRTKVAHGSFVTGGGQAGGLVQSAMIRASFPIGGGKAGCGTLPPQTYVSTPIGGGKAGCGVPLPQTYVSTPAGGGKAGCGTLPPQTYVSTPIGGGKAGCGTLPP